ncbi:MAG: circularly permuted type 2 ATP-grasp protein [Rhodobacteraceae bacterium]|nr:circularly permuted type 2 ATP-grasp protein [Paracoccaceae bacterium]
MFDEMRSEGGIRPAYAGVQRWIDGEGLERLRGKSRDAEALFRRGGITFAVYGDGGDPERLIPFDLIPRVFAPDEWAFLEKGVVQRAKALNAFLSDVYGAQEILKAGLMPRELVLENSAFESRLIGVQPPGGVFSHIVGVDLVRLSENEFYVLEDNCRTPSGVSYMMENRAIMMRLFPDLFEETPVAPVENYPIDLRRTLRSVAPQGLGAANGPTMVVLTPGTLNSAYYEHVFLADQMGLELVQGADLYVDDGWLWMRTTGGPQRVDVVYRRIDDDFIDPSFFRPDSMLGVPGLIDVYRAGRVALVSAPGSGVADDKAIYTYVPDMVKFYLGEESILSNVPTWRCAEPSALAYVLERLDELVVKEVHGSGGYGMLIGPKSTAAEREAYAARLKADPGNFIAQPTLALSSCPTLVEDGVAPRHVDLRPFALVGADKVRLTPGGLTRVALREGSLVVNSSQGGGVKDTWVLRDVGATPVNA